MEGSPGPGDLRKQLMEREAEVLGPPVAQYRRSAGNQDRTSPQFWAETEGDPPGRPATMARPTGRQGEQLPGTGRTIRPLVEPTHNRGERTLRPPVIAPALLRLPE